MAVSGSDIAVEEYTFFSSVVPIQYDILLQSCKAVDLSF